MQHRNTEGPYVTGRRANEIIHNHVGFPDRQIASFLSTNMCQSQYAIIIVFCWFFVAEGGVVRNENICGPQNGRRLYLELGERGVLYAKNVSFLTNAQRQQDSRVYVSNSSHEQCSLELVTCPSCVIIVTFKSLSLSQHCGDGSVTVDSPCRCDYVWISEPPYEDVSGTPFCGLYAPITYRSSTRTLSIALLYSQSHKHAFTLEYVAERNRLHLRGTDMMTGVAKGLNSTGGGILTSPFFPTRYPRDLGLEYVITCPTEAPSCRIRLLFSDFQLAAVSIMEFYDWNGQRLDVSSGARFRPPVIVSSGPSLLIRFYANGGTGLGYKAFYSFVIGHRYDKSIQPITDCGGYVENLGGAITMMDMVGQGAKTYDCVWLIRPPKNFLHMKTHMYLKVVAFADMAGNTELTIKQGPTSALLPLEILRHPASQLQPQPRYREHVTPVTSGFHVSLRGTFGPSSHLAIAYAAFSYTDCFTGSDFLCQNHRCIPSQLNCDGFDHCGDNSDEPATCFRDWELEPQDRKWHTNKPNYYFPKIDRYPDLKTATLVFVASSLGLIVLISALIILLYRMGARARQQRELQSRLQTISELLVLDIADGARIDEITVADDPPVYEAPPGYDEVVKLSLEVEGVRRKKRRTSGNRESRSRSSNSQCSTTDQEVPSSTCLTVEGASTSRSSQTTPIPATSARRAVPESPPPPYVTPPGTMLKSFNTVSSPASLETDPLNGRRSRPRHSWYRAGGESFRSLPGMERASSAPSVSSSSSSLATGLKSTSADEVADEVAEQANTSVDSDVQALGAYLRPSSSWLVSGTSDCSAPQPSNSRDALRDTSVACEGGSNEQEKMAKTAGRPEELSSDADGRGEDNRTRREVRGTACWCEGACGCASNTEKLKNRVNGIVDEENSSPKNAIVRLLRSSSNRSARLTPCVSLNSTTVSTASSTPSKSISRSLRRITSVSRDSYLTRFPTITSCNSYDKLQNDLENEPAPAKNRRLEIQRCGSCDLESLYAGIKVLESFLERRGSSVHVLNNRPKISVSAMQFSTPNHGARGFGAGFSRDDRQKRSWWSTDSFGHSWQFQSVRPSD